MPHTRGLTTTQAGYGAHHQRLRSELAPLVLAGGVRCWRCGEPIRPNDRWDLGHVDGDRSRYAGPEHAKCNRGATRYVAPRPPEPEPERDGLDRSDERWGVPWLRGLRRVPANATWPRLMTVPHPQAVGSFGKEFSAWAELRTGRPLRWWQRLVAARLLEHDDAERLVWEEIVLSMARQLGKSWLLRELCLWRIEQAGLFGEPQDVMHTGKDLAICKEVQRTARLWAKARPGTYKVREVNGQEEIELLADGSRWMVRAKEAVYGYAVSLAAVDEAWKVRPHSVDEGLVPTMAEREQPQLLLVSTAHRLATPLMLSRRLAALSSLEDGDGALLIEWSAPKGAELDDVAAWRQASPYWTPRRQQLVASRLRAAREGAVEDPDEPDPVEAYKAQWLNIWPAGFTVLEVGEELLPVGLWARLAEDGLRSDGPLWVAVEDNFGQGAAVAAAALLADGRIEVDGWLCPDWDSALEDVRMLGAVRPIRQFQVGASMLSRVPPGTVPPPQAAGSVETRPGLALLRDLAAGGMVAHDTSTGELDQAVASARVKEGVAGLQLVAGVGAPHLVRALVWAVQGAHRPTPVPAIY